ncbi:hypothetical protein ACIRFH_28085 [Streptomyces sp. NPDC093586]|uniref:hypothetical protein n=1 Tax=Streptomyces sp. NPDC093586 TaxID=3366042 RepID=UPI00381CD86C
MADGVDRTAAAADVLVPLLGEEHVGTWLNAARRLHRRDAPRTGGDGMGRVRSPAPASSRTAASPRSGGRSGVAGTVPPPNNAGTLTPDGRPYDLLAEVPDVQDEGGMRARRR